jgi:hypothetical protein
LEGGTTVRLPCCISRPSLPISSAVVTCTCEVKPTSRSSPAGSLRTSHETQVADDRDRRVDAEPHVPQRALDRGARSLEAAPAVVVSVR